jgi:hypothetical protein
MKVTVLFAPSRAAETRVFMRFSKRAKVLPAQCRRTATWTGGQIAQQRASGKMQKVVE